VREGGQRYLSPRALAPVAARDTSVTDLGSPRRRLSREERAGWKSTYERSDFRDLPWFSDKPSPWLVRGVNERWIRPGEKVLDVGCGAGTNVLWLARHGFASCGVDVAPGAIAAARARAAIEKLDVTLEVGEATALPFADGEFGAALDSGCFHTLPIELRSVYAEELHRVVRPGGTVFLIWIGREETREMGPTHRPSLAEVSAVFEPHFIFATTEFAPPDSDGGWSTPGGSLALYTSRLLRRPQPQPPFR
jgi:SAM-dependent methyltransferase